MPTLRVKYLILFCFFASAIFAQPFGNEWINYGQTYYKFKIAKDGLYMLDSATLASAGVPLNTFDARNIQLFQKGKQLACYIPGESDGVLNAKDYILFYATQNTGTDDSLYFDNVSYLTNPYYSPITDTSAVFLTWNNLTNNKRLTVNNDTTFSSYNNSPYFIRQIISPRGNYGMGPLNIYDVSDPRYKLGEGFYFFEVHENQPAAIFIDMVNLYTAGPPVKFTVSFSGANDIAGVSPDHIIETSYLDNTNNPVIVSTVPVDGYQNYRQTFTVSPSVFGTSTILSCSSLVNTQTSISNYTDISYMVASVPCQFNMLGKSAETIYLPDDGSQAQSKLVITNFSGTHPFFINLTDSNIHTLKSTGSAYITLVPNTGKTKFCYLSDSTNISKISALAAVNGNGKFVDYASQLADSNYLIVYHPKLNATDSAVNKYKTYRSSMAGGNFPVLTASILDIYDQFGYGVEISPMSIRNFCAWVINAPYKNPSNLFLVGKSIHSIDCFDPQFKPMNLVPSWGNPSSDILITKGLPGSQFLEPAIPTGRLSAQTEAQVESYLDKVKLYEQQSGDSLWKKHAIHFVGGSDFLQQQTLSYYMNSFRTTYRDTFMGGEVFSFYKTTTAPVSVTTNDSVKKLIEEGVSLMTFFGHGSQTGFDQNIDDPQNYNNSPKFPLIIANSCYTGDIHSGIQESHSEVYTLAPNNHGSIAYIATTSEGMANDLFWYTGEFYNQMCKKSYGSSYAGCMRNTINKLMYDKSQGQFAGDTVLEWTCLEMTLHGDPALSHYHYAKPDYAIKNSDLIFNTTSYPDSIGLNIVMTNLARAQNDTFVVKIERNFPNGDTVAYYKQVKAPHYKDTLSFFIAKDYAKAVGINCFSVELDFLKLIPEESEANNKTVGNVCLFIPGADIEPVWPYKYAIVPNINNITLKASTADPFASLTTYRFQVDTNDKYLTPLVNTTISSAGGVVSLPVTLYNQDSMVYFWRVCKDDNDTLNWKESSFQVITGKHGWAQAQFNQFKNDAYQFVVYSDTTPRQFKFVQDVKSVEVVDVIPTPPAIANWTDVIFYLNGAQERMWSCARNGWTVAVFDSLTGNLQYSDTLGPKPPGGWLGTYGNCVCALSTRNALDFGNNTECGDQPDWQTNLTNFIQNGIPNGDYVLAYSVRCWDCPWSYSTAPHFQDTLRTSTINALKSIGSSKIDSLQDSTILIIFGRKGMLPGQAHEVISHTWLEKIDLKDSIITKFKNGYIASEIIGPCKYADSAWKSLHWYYTDLATDSSVNDDGIYIALIGIKANGQKDVITNFPKDSLNVLDLYNWVNGKQYPYLQLIAYESDNVNNTPPQLKRWQVIYDQAPEAAIDPPSGFSVVKTTVQEGEDYQVRVPIKNISDQPFNDSLVVTYMLEDANRVNHPLSYKLKRKPFLPDSVIMDTISLPTLGYSGSNILWVDVNPPGHAKYQPEQYHFNNVAQIAFDVNRDKTNPLLDITFDGVHILNGDIVSAKPNILIGLKDENKFLALNDTSNFMVYVQYPGSSTEKRLFFKDELMFSPAQLPNNSCKINYKPNYPQDGVYALRVVATDRSKNVSGQMDYRIQFEIVNKPTITEVLNYPNPFSTSTKFVFTITGSEVPETFKIQVLTITGRVVKEITREELGFLHVGRNITDYAWDGTDQFGDKLANGVYLYRVETRLNGKEIDHLSTAADSYFKKGYGKMLLMR